MVLTAEEEIFIEKIRSLGPQEAERIRVWVNQLSDLAQGQTIDYSDSWSDEDLADITALSLRRFEEQEQEGI
jgi:hypothetical protein